MPKVSFRGEGPWEGMTRQTTQGRGAGRFFLIRNGYVSLTGEEIRSLPGMRVVVDLEETPATRSTGWNRDVIDARRPIPTATENLSCYAKKRYIHGFEQVRGKLIFFGEVDFRRDRIEDAGASELTLVSWAYASGPDELTLTMSGNVVATTTQFGHVAVDDFLSLEGLDSPVLWEIAFMKVKSVATTSIVLDANSIDMNGATSGTAGFVAKVLYNDDAGSRVPIEPFDQYPLASWQVEGKPSLVGPITTCRPAYCAYVQRDFGDKTGNYIEGHDNAPRRRSRQLPYRMVPDVAGNRLLLGAPGYGCVFQVPVILPQSTDTSRGTDSIFNDVYDRPRCLGVPKGQALEMREDNEQGLIATVIAPAGLDAGVYKFAIGYRDEATGEVGLTSEVVEVEITATDNTTTVEIFWMHPGYAMSECLALSYVLFISDKGGEIVKYNAIFSKNDTGSFDTMAYGLVPTSGAVSQPVLFGQNLFNKDYIDDLDQFEAVQEIEQMPMGCKALRTIKGTTIFVGHLGSIGYRRELEKGSASFKYDGNVPPTGTDPLRDWLTVRNYGAQSSPLAGRDQEFNVAMPVIPGAYGGVELFGENLFPNPVKTVLLSKIVNPHTDFDGSDPRYPDRWFQRWELDIGASVPGISVSNQNKTAYLKLPRGRYQWSEQDNPGVVAATSSGIVDAEEEDDGEAIGRMGEAAVICTRNHTYRLAWGRTPANQYPQLVTPDFGCIAPNTMVEFDNGCAWISERGPCAIIGGAFAWIGENLEPLFSGSTARYLRDSDGMMRHAWSCYDDTRGLLLFGLYTEVVTLDFSTYKLPVHIYSNILGDGVADPGDPSFVAATKTWSDCGDKEKSRFPCNEILVWSVRSGAWSVWNFPDKVVGFPQWMRVIECDDDQRRLCFLSTNGKLYAMDDTYAVENREPIIGFALQAKTNSDSFEVAFDTYNKTDVYANDTVTKVDMEYILYSNQEGSKHEIIQTGLIKAIPSLTEVTLDIAATWELGDILLVGVLPEMVLETLMEPGVEIESVELSGIQSRYSLHSMINRTGGSIISDLN